MRARGDSARGAKPQSGHRCGVKRLTLLDPRTPSLPHCRLPIPHCPRKETEWADKPGFVEGDHFSRTAIARRLQRHTRESNGTGRSAAALLPTPHSPLLGLAPGGVYPASEVTPTAVRSYRTFSPLPADCFPGRTPEPTSAGGIFSVALSRFSRTVGVTHHRAPRSPDFPLRGAITHTPQRSPGPLRLGLHCRTNRRRAKLNSLVPMLRVGTPARDALRRILLI